MVTTRKIYGSMFDEVHKLVAGFGNRNLTEADWHNLFDYNYKWKQPENYSGYGLFDGGNLVGFIGLIFSNRLIDQRMEQFCNLTGWYVLEEHRGHSVSLLLPVLKMRDCTFTDLSPSPLSCLLLPRFGFKELDSKLRIIFPGRIAGWRKSNNNVVAVTHDKAVIEKRLQGKELVLFRDHLGYKCRHLLLSDNTSSCYVVYTEMSIGRFPYCYVHYISSRDAFVKYSEIIVSEITRVNKAKFAVVDSRLVANLKIPHSFAVPFRSRKLYKSSTLKPDQVDNLYSELVLLNLGAFPKLRNLCWDMSVVLSKKIREWVVLASGVEP